MSVYKRANRWYYDFMIRRRRYREVIPEARTKADAIEAEVKAREEVYAGRYGARRFPTLREYCDRVLIPWINTNHQSAIKSLYRLNNLLTFFGSKRLNLITIIELEKYKRHRLDAGRSPVTINKEIKLLKQIMRQAHEAGIINQNPLRAARTLREPDHRQRVLSADEEIRLLDACPVGFTDNVTALRFAIQIALATGMRQGEIYSLRWDQIDRERQTITLEKTKTARARTIPIAPQLAVILDSIPRTSERVINGVFYHELWARACERAKITGLRFHDLRHTAATRLADAGADPFTIAAILGHSSIVMTARYAHSTSERTRSALEKLAATLSQTDSIPSAEDPVTRSAWRNILRKHDKAEVA